MPAYTPFLRPALPNAARRGFRPALLALAAAALLAGAPAGATGVVHTLDVTGVPSWGLRGDVHNTVVLLDVGAGTVIDSLQWDVLFYGNGVPHFSYANELGIAFTNSAQTAGFAFRPGEHTDCSCDFLGGVASTGAGLLGDLSPGVAMPGGPEAYGGYVLANLYSASPDFRVGADGQLRIEFFEYDVKQFPANEPDGLWVSGTLGFGATPAVPEPQALALMLVGLLAVGFVGHRRQQR